MSRSTNILPSVFDPSDILTLEQLASRLQVKKSSIYVQMRTARRRRDKNPLPAFRVGRYLRFRWSEVSAWLESKRVKAVSR
jgi:excisionase family DNA binding protein